MLNVMISLKQASFQPSLFLCIFSLFLSVLFQEPAWIFIVTDRKNKVWHVFSSNTYRRCTENEQKSAALLIPLSGFSVYRLCFYWHLRSEREGWTWFGSELIRDADGREVKDIVALPWSSNDSLFSESVPMSVSQDNRNFNIEDYSNILLY